MMRERDRALSLVSVVIPHWNTPERLAACLDSLACEGREFGMEVIVVDNGSAPGRAPRAPFTPAATTLIRNDRNLGFAVACNQGAATAAGEFLMFLNSDAELLAGALRALVASLEREPSFAAIAALELGSHGELGSPGRRFLGPLDQALGLCGLPRARPARRPCRAPDRGVGETPWVRAAAVLVRASAFRSVGGFDEGYFFYEEDEDLCWRLRRRGWRVGVAAEAIVRHDGGASARGAGEWPALSLYAGQLRFVRRRGGTLAAAVYRLSVGMAAMAKALIVATPPVDGSHRPSLSSLLRLLWLPATTVFTTGA